MSVMQRAGYKLVTLLGDEEVSARAEDQLTEAQALKQITFPEMDDDGLASSYIGKVLTCLGKWQVKMGDLSVKLSFGGHSSLKPPLGL